MDHGKEAHLGSQLYDMDGDGDLDMVSVGWDEYQHLHLWRNDAKSPQAMKWKHLSSSQGDISQATVGGQQTAALTSEIPVKIW